MIRDLPSAGVDAVLGFETHNRAPVVIVGAGVVGSALAKAIDGRTVYLHDPPKGLEVPPPLARECAVAFVCVPSDPVREGGDLDIALVEEAVDSLARLGFEGVVAIRSTVPPGTTDSLAMRFPWLHFAFVPEFLTEATAEEDAARPPRNVVGLQRLSDQEGEALWAIVAALPKAESLHVMRAREAEILKLLTNSLYATKVALANQGYDLAESFGCSWARIEDALRNDPLLGPNHVEVWHKGFRGFGGKCLPKDLDGLRAAFRHAGVSTDLLDAVASYNRRLRERG